LTTAITPTYLAMSMLWPRAASPATPAEMQSCRVWERLGLVVLLRFAGEMVSVLTVIGNQPNTSLPDTSAMPPLTSMK
jgi:hypothetical protein